MGASHRLTGELQLMLAAMYADQGRFEEAEPLIRRATEILAAALGPSHFQVLNALEVRVSGDTVTYVINGTVVHTTPKSELKTPTDGTVGFRVNHVTEVQVDGCEVQKS